jgi:hypothetical protein
VKSLAVLLAVVALAAPALGINIILNPSFETWLGSVPLGWLSSELLYPGSAAKDSHALAGNWCVRLNSADTTAFISSATIVRPGYSYRFSGFARVPGVLGGSFVLQFLSLTGGVVGSPILLPAYYSGNSYREYARWVTAPDSASLLSVNFAAILGAAAYVDSVTLDDTSFAAVAEPAPLPAPAAYRPGLRKVISARGLRASACSGRVMLDPLGRRMAPSSRLPGGVYFVLPERD